MKSSDVGDLIISYAIKSFLLSLLSLSFSPRSGSPPAVLLMLGKRRALGLGLSLFPPLLLGSIPDAQQCQECAISEVLLDNPLPLSLSLCVFPLLLQSHHSLHMSTGIDYITSRRVQL